MAKLCQTCKEDAGMCIALLTANGEVTSEKKTNEPMGAERKAVFISNVEGTMSENGCLQINRVRKALKGLL